MAEAADVEYTMATHRSLLFAARSGFPEAISADIRPKPPAGSSLQNGLSRSLAYSKWAIQKSIDEARPFREK
jgi:hypothetical protein